MRIHVFLQPSFWAKKEKKKISMLQISHTTYAKKTKETWNLYLSNIEIPILWK